MFNIASGEKITVKDLAKTIIELTGSSSKIVHLPARAADIVYSEADITKARNMLGWSPKWTLREGLKKTIEFYRKA